MDHCHTSQLSILVPTSVVMASFLGSVHCVSMCGPLIAHVAKRPIELVIYHISRLLGYMSLGLASGWLGSVSLTSHLPMINYSARLVLSGYFFFLAFCLLTNRSFHSKGTGLYKLISWLFQVSDSPAIRAGLIGASSVLLPCGWLYAFVFGSIATVSPLRGMILMSCFWIGTLPALTMSNWIIRTVFSPIKRIAPRLSAAVLILTGLVTILYRF